jgi:hypothetical protein
VAIAATTVISITDSLISQVPLVRAHENDETPS